MRRRQGFARYQEGLHGRWHYQGPPLLPVRGLRLDREYDQPSFDPTYNSDSVERLVPLVAEVFGRMPFWWEPKDKAEEKLGPKARLAVGYSLTIRD